MWRGSCHPYNDCDIPDRTTGELQKNGKLLVHIRQGNLFPSGCSAAQYANPRADDLKVANEDALVALHDF